MRDSRTTLWQKLRAGLRVGSNHRAYPHQATLEAAAARERGGRYQWSGRTLGLTQ